jgi:outer membrane murein-binding lipoprotein Lpp
MLRLALAAIVAGSIPLAGCDRLQKKTAEVEEAAPQISPEEQAAADAAAEAGDVYAAASDASVGAARTEGELTAAAEAAFKEADQDKDGKLSQIEFYSLASLLAPTVVAVETVDDVFAEEPTVLEAIEEPAPEGGEELLDGAAQAALDQRYAEIAGADGAIAVDELSSALLLKFAEADEDGDGGLNDLESENFRSMKLF